MNQIEEQEWRRFIMITFGQLVRCEVPGYQVGGNEKESAVGMSMILSVMCVDQNFNDF